MIPSLNLEIKYMHIFALSTGAEESDFVFNFEVSTEILFGDGFELGDTSAWTEDLPEGTGSFASAVESPMIG